jgi:hypothetical protein
MSNLEKKVLETVNEFQISFNHYNGDGIIFPPEKSCNLRLDLINEEEGEYIKGVKEENKLEIVDGLCDLAYVIAGAYLTFGIKPKISKDHFVSDELYIEACKNKDFISVQRYLDYKSKQLKNYIKKHQFKSFLSAFYETHRSNMSKACSSLETAHKTMAQEKYKDIPVDFIERDGLYFIHKKENSKTIKSIDYSEANFTPYINNILV